MLGLERNQGWRAVRRGHADDAAGWFVSIGRLWRERGGRWGEICSVADVQRSPILTGTADSISPNSTLTARIL